MLQTTQTERHKRLILPPVNVPLHNSDICAVSSPMISMDIEDLLSDPTLFTHVCLLLLDRSLLACVFYSLFGVSPSYAMQMWWSFCFVSHSVRSARAGSQEDDQLCWLHRVFGQAQRQWKDWVLPGPTTVQMLFQNTPPLYLWQHQFKDPIFYQSKKICILTWTLLPGNTVYHCMGFKPPVHICVAFHICWRKM